ncbi:hypothetical protein L3Y34_001270 [Caenorhabditis briggsae]|uniref:Uncharacterized protein n=1 Tax=Caenorhabditis briggsae TaxID=6238 RepID=A0AAE9IPR5_CAEBR|nr:hypothetical protein L3Y34_001270 [Caenorhabditis briggsae]
MDYCMSKTHTKFSLFTMNDVPLYCMNQRPLMRKKPKTYIRQEDPTSTRQTELLILQAQTILEASTQDGVLRYEDFSTKFSKAVKKNFEVEFDRIHTLYGWSLADIVGRMTFRKHICSINEDEKGLCFEFTLIQQLATTSSSSELSKQVDHSLRDISTSAEVNPVVCKGFLANAGTSFESTRLSKKTPAEYSMKMMSWPWLSEMKRTERRDLLRKFFESAENITQNDIHVQREAKNLGTDLWKASIPNFPHVMWLLHELSKRKPNGFKFPMFESEINNVIPNSWKLMWEDLSCEDLIPEPSTLILLDLIIPSELNDPQIVEVTELVNFIRFHEIRDNELSLIYHFVDSAPSSKSALEVHKFLCETCSGWEDEYNDASGLLRVEAVFQGNKKMFHDENGSYTTKQHHNKIAVPMCFLPITNRYNNGNRFADV